MGKLYNPVAIYNFCNRKYFIAFDEDKIVYFKYEMGRISSDYSDEELEVFFKVYNSIKIDKDSAVNLGCINLKNKVFETFYDINKELYFWYELVNEKRQNVSKADLELLNYKYNNVCLKYAKDDISSNTDENNEINESSRTFTRAIMHKGKTIAIIILSGLSLIAFSDFHLHPSIENRGNSSIGESGIHQELKDEIIENQQYDFEMITYAIDSNPYLGESEKNFFKMFKSYFDQNNEYMDLKTVVDRLSNLKVIYCTDECKAYFVAGEYDIVDNVIRMYRTDGFEGCDKSVLTHEFFHVTQVKFSNRFALELSNEAATREYLRELVETGNLDEEEFKNEYKIPDYGHGYDACMKVYYLLANLLDQDKIGMYQCTPTDTIITDGLVELDKKGQEETSASFDKNGMEQRALAVLEAVDELRNSPDSNGYWDMDYSDEKFEKVCELLDYYYQIKYDRRIDECFVECIMNYDNSSGIIYMDTPKNSAICTVMMDEIRSKVDQLDEEDTKPMGWTRYVLPRTYFSDRHENPIIYQPVFEFVSSELVHPVFLGIELTPEVNKAYCEQYQIEKEKLECSSGIKNFDDTDYAESTDVDRE